MKIYISNADVVRFNMKAFEMFRAAFRDTV